MNPETHAIRTKLAAVALLFLVALPLAAAPKRRSIQPLPDATVKGIVTDQTTGKPVAAADVFNGDRYTQTDANGAFEIKVPAGRSTPISARRSGYETGTVNVTATGTQNVTIPLKGKPTVQVRTTGGTVYQLDFESAQFAYLVPFSGYSKSDEGNFCTTDGKPFKPSKETIAKVIGPATDAQNAGCCKVGAMKVVNVQLKDGSTTQSFFNDSCFGFEVDFLGRDHVSAQFVYLKFSEIAEITFP